MSETSEQQIKDFAEMGWITIRESAVRRSNGIPEEGQSDSNNNSQFPRSGAPSFDISLNEG